MPNNTILNIIKSTVNCTGDCAVCTQNDCTYKVIAQALINEGVVKPIFCKECVQFDPELGICKIRYDSYGSILERGPHDWCSDGSTSFT